MKPKQPLYVLSHGIEVVGEYPARGANPYARVRMRPHPFFPGVRVVCGAIVVHRSRAVLASKLGRALTPQEHAHHDDECRDNDAPDNVEPLSAAEHNRHHKTGSKHTEQAKARISAGLKRAIAEGRRATPKRPAHAGAKHSEETKRRISAARKALIACGAIPKPVPPSTKGRPMPEAAIERIRAAKLAYWSTKKEAR